MCHSMKLVLNVCFHRTRTSYLHFGSGLEQVHSDYTVVVMLEVGPNESSPQEGFTSECNMTWIEVSAAARLSAQVRDFSLLYWALLRQSSVNG